jgi:hypothetical protein
MVGLFEKVVDMMKFELFSNLTIGRAYEYLEMIPINKINHFIDLYINDIEQAANDFIEYNSDNDWREYCTIDPETFEFYIGDNVINVGHLFLD